MFVLRLIREGRGEMTKGEARWPLRWHLRGDTASAGLLAGLVLKNSFLSAELQVIKFKELTC